MTYHSDNKDVITVFLGGTCNHSTWRDELIAILNPEKVSCYNPVVPDWTPECMQEELRQRAICDFCLYVITPKMTGVYSIAEAVDDSNKRPDRTLFCVLEKDGDEQFTKGQMMSLMQVSRVIEKNGGKFFENIQDIACFLEKKLYLCNVELIPT